MMEYRLWNLAGGCRSRTPFVPVLPHRRLVSFLRGRAARRSRSTTARTPYTYTNPPVSKRSTSTPAATCGAADKKGCTSTCAVLILWTYGRVGRWQVVSSDQWTRGDAAAMKPRYTVRAKQNKPYQQRGRRALFREQTPILGRFSLRVEEGGANG